MAKDSNRQIFKCGFSTKISLIVVALTIFGATQAYAAVSGAKLYSLIYNGPENGADEATDIAIGPKRTVYVVGTSGNDYAVIKYGRKGATKWVRRYSGPEPKQIEEAQAVVVDKRGNAYVTGTSPKRGNGNDIVTIKYSPAGNRKWVRRFNAKANLDDSGEAIAIGSKSIYVLGRSRNRKKKTDMVLIKYGLNGKTRWIKRFNRNGSDLQRYSLYLAVDSRNNVCVTGCSAGDYATTKFSSAGKKRWSRRYDNNGGNDAPTGIALNDDGDVYVTGSSASTDAMVFAIVKYNKKGRKEWVRQYGDAKYFYNIGSSVDIDAKGNCYITGSSYGDRSEKLDFLTIKYDQDGNKLWARRLKKFDMPVDLIVDKKGNSYIAGLNIFSTNWKYVALKYDTSGKIIWKNTVPNFGMPSAAALDSAGAFYITGFREGVYEEDFFTIKFAR